MTDEEKELYRTLKDAHKSLNLALIAIDNTKNLNLVDIRNDVVDKIRQTAGELLALVDSVRNDR